MAKIKNSLSTYLEQAMVMTGNSLETIDKIRREQIFFIYKSSKANL